MAVILLDLAKAPVQPAQVFALLQAVGVLPLLQASQVQALLRPKRHEVQVNHFI